MTRLFARKFYSDLRAAKLTVKEAVAFLREAVPTMQDELAADLRLVFDELLINAVLHGNHSDTRKAISFEIELTGGYMRSRVTDEGGGFDYRQTMESCNSSDSLLEEHGRGLVLASHITDDMRFGGNGNIIEFSKRLVEE